jgi:hypothetical protein
MEQIGAVPGFGKKAAAHLHAFLTEAKPATTNPD